MTLSEYIKSKYINILNAEVTSDMALDYMYDIMKPESGPLKDQYNYIMSTLDLGQLFEEIALKEEGTDLLLIPIVSAFKDDLEGQLDELKEAVKPKVVADSSAKLSRQLLIDKLEDQLAEFIATETRSINNEIN